MTQSEKKSFYEYIGVRLRELRENVGLTQEQLANQIGKHRVTIVNIEKGRQQPPLYMIIEFARILKVKPSDFVDYERWNKVQSVDDHLEQELKKSISSPRNQEKLKIFYKEA